MSMSRRLLLLATMLLASGTANANTTVTISFQENGGPLTTIAGASNIFAASGTTANFGLIATGSVVPNVGIATSFASSDIDVQLTSGGAHTLTVTVAAIGQQSLAPPTTLSTINGFTSNLLPADWKVTESVYYNLSNGILGTSAGSVLLAFHDFTTTGATGPLAAAPFVVPTGAAFSLIHEYVITTSATSAANEQTENTIVTTPGPIVGAGLPGLVVALGGLVGFARRRRQQIA